MNTTFISHGHKFHDVVYPIITDENGKYSVAKPFRISNILVSLHSNSYDVRYQGTHRDGAKYLHDYLGGGMKDYPACRVFATKEDAEIECIKRNAPKPRQIDVQSVVVPKSFKFSNPSTEKISKRIHEYRTTGKFITKIVVGEDGTLKDGYTAYLVAKMLDIPTLLAEVA
jgi:hypothetical protein